MIEKETWAKPYGFRRNKWKQEADMRVRVSQTEKQGTGAGQSAAA